MAIDESYDPNLPPVIGPQPNRWLWLQDGKLYTMLITKVTDHSDKINVIWWDDNNDAHKVTDARHVSKVPPGTPCWVSQNPNTGSSGYCPTA